jgi:hypothetical protein
MSLLKVIEVLTESNKSWEDAAQQSAGRRFDAHDVGDYVVHVGLRKDEIRRVGTRWHIPSPKQWK